MLTHSITLTSDLSCPGDALIIGASDLIVDLNGHTLTGPGAGSPTWPQPNLASSGVKVTGQSSVSVRNGTITKFSSAIVLEATNNARVSEVQANANYYGIYLRNGAANEIARSKFTGNIYGVTLYGGGHNAIRDNESSKQTHFSPGGYGVYVYTSDENTFSGNTFRENDNWGIWLSSSRNNVFFHNNIIGNHPQVSDDSGGNIWFDAQHHEGNYWADWEGRELAGTGIGNHPYLIQGPGGATDQYPFVRENGWSQPRSRAPESTATAVPTRSAGGGGLLIGLPGTNQIGTVEGAFHGLVSLTRLNSNLALSTDARTLYVVDEDVLRAFDVGSGAERRTYPLASVRTQRRVSIAADRDGEHLHVLDGTHVLTLHLADGNVAQDVPYPSEPVGVFPSWKHRLLLVADRLGDSVDVVWVGGGRVTYRIPMPGAPVALAANRAGTRLYAAVPGSASVPVVETEQYAVVDRIGSGLDAQRDVATSADASQL